MNTRKQHLAYCQRCENRAFDRQKGVICSLTNEIAQFEKTCPDFVEDEKVKAKTSEKDEFFKQEEKDGKKLIHAFLMTAALPVLFTIALLMGGTYTSILVYVQDIFIGIFLGLFFSSVFYRLQFFRYRFRKAIRIFGEETVQFIGVLLFGVLIILQLLIRFYEFEL